MHKDFLLISSFIVICNIYIFFDSQWNKLDYMWKVSSTFAGIHKYNYIVLMQRMRVNTYQNLHVLSANTLHVWSLWSNAIFSLLDMPCHQIQNTLECNHNRQIHQAYILKKKMILIERVLSESMSNSKVLKNLLLKKRFFVHFKLWEIICSIHTSRKDVFLLILYFSYLTHHISSLSFSKT